MKTMPSSMLSFLAIAAVIQASAAVPSPFTQDDEEVVNVVEPDIVAELPEQHSSIALAAKAKRHKRAKLPFAEENNEEIVRVVDPDIVTDPDVVSDGFDGKAMPTKSLMQHLSKVVDKDALDSDAETDASQDAHTSAKMDAKIEFQDDEADEDVVMTVDFNKVQADDAKGKAAKSEVRDATATKANVTSVVHEKSGAKKLSTLSVTKTFKANVTSVVHANLTAEKLSTLSVKRTLRGSFVDDSGKEYVDPSQVQSAVHNDEEYSAVEPAKFVFDPQAAYGEPAQVEGDTAEQSVASDIEDVPKQPVANDIDDVPEPPAEDVPEPTVITAAQNHQADCNEGNQFNNNDC